MQPIALLLVLAAGVQDPPKPKPLFREFMGLNGHTVQFRPKLYKAVGLLARDYHPMTWDLGQDTDHKPGFPFARNRVDWEKVYGSWKAEGFDVHVSLMFQGIKAETWKDRRRDAHAYGLAFARAFGPSSGRKLVSSVEIGNEPGFYDAETYETLFDAMARGLREGDPALRIATCNVTTGKSTDWDRHVGFAAGRTDLYDVLNIHVYAWAKKWPTWRRSFPEDPSIAYLKEMREMIAWRDAHAPGKEIWLTEFGWDASTRDPDPKGTFAKWEDSSDAEQAAWLVRSFLVFAALDLDRAYVYFFNDKDEPSLHASSGLTRNFVPKPAFHAVAHLFRTLGEYRFVRAREEKAGDRYVYEFAHATDTARKVLAVWSPTGSGRRSSAAIALGGATLERAERMPLGADEKTRLELTVEGDSVTVPVEERPVYLFLAP